MNGMKMRGGVAIVAFLGMAFGAGTLQADPGPRGRVDIAKALRYEAAAESVGRTPEFFQQAAEYLEAAADFRPEGDSQGVQDLVSASRLRFYAGDEGRAQSLLKEAGEVALAYGDVGAAAEAFLDAAWIARKRGLAPVAQDLLSRAHKLTQSPLLEESQRSVLLSRIVVSPS